MDPILITPSDMELPLELVEAILDNVLSSTDLGRCSLVCKDWRILGQSRLFKSISLRKASKTPQLLEILRTSSHIPSAIRTVDINFISLAVVWKHMDMQELAGTVFEILDRVNRPHTLVLRGPTSHDRIIWSGLSPELQNSIMNFMRLVTLRELEIDGWVFDTPIHEFFSMLAVASSLRRLRLNHAASGLHSGLDIPEGYKPVNLNLDLLEVHIDDHLDMNPQVASDFSQLFQLDPASQLELKVWVNTALWSFGNLGEFLTRHLAEQVQTLELAIGFRNNRIYSLSSSAQLQHLTIDGFKSPAALQFARQTLLTLPDQNSLRGLTLKLCFYTLPRKQWTEFIQFLATLPGLDSLQRVHFAVQTNEIQAKEADFELGGLRERGWEATVRVNEGEGAGTKRPFPFYLYSRF